MTTETKAPPAPRNGVDTPNLLATINVVAGQPELAKFKFTATNRWIEGTHSQTTMLNFEGAGGAHEHKKAYTADGDHPAVLCGGDEGPTPIEWVLHALTTCITAGIGNIASVRGVDLYELQSTVEGDIDLRGILGLSDEVRNGFSNIRVSFKIKGDAPEEKLQQIVEQGRARSAVYDIVTNGVPVHIDVDAESAVEQAA
jgi:uncharacterized OsmC-like protein